MGTLGKKGNKVFELPVLSFHFISLPRHTARRARLDLGLGPRMTNARGVIFVPLSFSLFSTNQRHLRSVVWEREWQRVGMPPCCQRPLSALKASS